MTESPSIDRFVRSSPFVDGYHIERHPVTTMSDEPFDEAREQERFDRIVRCIEIPRHGKEVPRKEWIFSQAPFTSVPPPETAQWWLAHLNLEDKEVAPLPADVLAPLVAGWAGVDAALTDTDLRFGDYLARRALLPLASPELQAEWNALAAQPLPEEITVGSEHVNYLSKVATLLKPDFVRSAVVRGRDEEVRQRVRELFAKGAPRGQWSDWLNYDAATTVLLLPEAERKESWPSSWWPLSFHDWPFPPDISPLAAAAPEIFYERTIHAGSSLGESLVAMRRALPLRTGPVAAAAWLGGLRIQGTSPALEWLHDHPLALLAADIPAEEQDDLLSVLRSFSDDVLMTGKNAALPDVRSAIDIVLAERSLETLDDPGQWWSKHFSGAKKRRKNIDGLGLEFLPPLVHEGKALTKARVNEFVQGLATGSLDDTALLSLKGHLTPESCDAFAQALLTLWLHRDAPNKASWMMTSTGVLGGEGYVAALITECTHCYWSMAHARGFKAMEALGKTSSNAALAYLLEEASSGPAKSARRRVAREQLDGIATRCGLTINQLEDRLLADIPDPSIKAQKARFLRAMIVGERWTYEDFIRYVIGHPVLCELTEALVWGVYKGEGHETLPVELFLIEGDDEPTDLDGNILSLPDDAAIGIVHPAEIPVEERTRWANKLAEKALVPPFKQMERTVFTLSAQEKQRKSLLGVPTYRATPKKLNGVLIQHAWDRGRAGDGGYITVFTLPSVHANITVVMVLSEMGMHAMPSLDSTRIMVDEVFVTPGVLPNGKLTKESGEPYELERLSWRNVPASILSEVVSTLEAL